MVDPVNGVLGVEFIDGPSVRSVLGGGADADDDSEEGDSDDWAKWLDDSGANKGSSFGHFDERTTFEP